MPDDIDERAWPELGDMPAEEFRTALHRVADWVADYRESIENLKVASPIKPGEIIARLPQAPPEHPVAFKDIFEEFHENHYAGHRALGTSPHFLGISVRQRLRSGF